MDGVILLCAASRPLYPMGTLREKEEKDFDARVVCDEALRGSPSFVSIKSLSEFL